jgi:hypothetical protein
MKTTANKYGEGKNTTDGNTYKDDMMALTMNGYDELDRNYEEKI